MSYEDLKDEAKLLNNAVKECPRCNGILELNIERKRLECPQCGIRIKVRSKHNDLLDGLEITFYLVIFMGVAFVLGHAWGILH